MSRRFTPFLGGPSSWSTSFSVSLNWQGHARVMGLIYWVLLQGGCVPHTNLMIGVPGRDPWQSRACHVSSSYSSYFGGKPHPGQLSYRLLLFTKTCQWNVWLVPCRQHIRCWLLNGREPDYLVIIWLYHFQTLRNFWRLRHLDGYFNHHKNSCNKPK